MLCLSFDISFWLPAIKLALPSWYGPTNRQRYGTRTLVQTFLLHLELVCDRLTTDRNLPIFAPGYKAFWSGYYVGGLHSGSAYHRGRGAAPTRFLWGKKGEQWQCCPQKGWVESWHWHDHRRCPNQWHVAWRASHKLILELITFNCFWFCCTKLSNTQVHMYKRMASHDIVNCFEQKSIGSMGVYSELVQTVLY